MDHAGSSFCFLVVGVSRRSRRLLPLGKASVGSSLDLAIRSRDRCCNCRIEC